MDKEKLSKILLIASLVLLVGAFCSLFAPAMNLQFFELTGGDKGKLIGTGVAISLFTFMLSLPSRVICNKTGGGIMEDTFIIRYFGKRSMIPSFIQFMVIVASIIVAVVILVLMLRHKFEGKKKLILSIVFWALLIATVGSMFFESEFVRMNNKNSTVFFDRNYDIKEYGLALAPILYAVFGGCALVSNVTSYILNRE